MERPMLRALALTAALLVVTSPARAQDALLEGVADVAIGTSHACALLADATVVCWGANAHGQIGDGSTTDRAAPAAVIGLGRRAVEVRAGGDQTCAIVDDGSVWCWGSDGLGDPATRPARPRPVRVGGLARATALAVGGEHACAIVAGGGVRCWGEGDRGAIGDGATEERAEAVAVLGLSGATALDAGWSHTCALIANGRVACWGSSFRHQIDVTTRDQVRPVVLEGAPSPVHAIATGGAHTCALHDDGRVTCWGADFDGACASDGVIASGPFTHRVGGVSDVVEIAAGEDHTCARTASGEVWCWGYELAGALDDASRGARGEVPRARPARVPGIAGATRIASGGRTSCARLADGTLRCWGSNLRGALGTGRAADEATRMPRAGSVASVFAGTDGVVGIHCFVRTDATVACWGASDAHGVGEGDARRVHWTPAVVRGLRDVVEVAPGREHVCARLRDGSVRCWGANEAGQLGDGGGGASARPVRVAGVAGAIAITSDATASCAVSADGALRCWGRLGGYDRPITRPSDVDVGGPVAAAALATAHACALRRDGRVVCWGASPAGPVEGIDDAIAVAVGSDSACALRRGATVVCWPFDAGAPGRPAAVSGVDHAVEIGVGDRYACARRDDGRVLCWGDGLSGGLPGTSPTPALAPIEGARDLATGPEHACVVVGTDALCWGGVLTGARREPPRPVVAPR